MQTAELRDQRLNRRLQVVLAQLAARPTASIPAACGGGRAEVEATYRFFTNEKVTFEHVERRLACLAVYLAVAWRTLFVCRLGREFPDIVASAFRRATCVTTAALLSTCSHSTYVDATPRKPLICAHKGGYW